jgi:hypothetical protein
MKNLIFTAAIIALLFSSEVLFAQNTVHFTPFSDSLTLGLDSLIPKNQKGREIFLRYTPTSQLSLQMACYNDKGVIEINLWDYDANGNRIQDRKLTISYHNGSWWYARYNWMDLNFVHQCLLDAKTRLGLMK